MKSYIIHVIEEKGKQTIKLQNDGFTLEEVDSIIESIATMQDMKRNSNDTNTEAK